MDDRGRTGREQERGSSEHGRFKSAPRCLLFVCWHVRLCHDTFYPSPCCEGMREKRLTGVALGETGRAGVAQWMTAAALGESRSVVAASTTDLSRCRAVCCLFVGMLVCWLVCLFVSKFIRFLAR